MLSAATIYGICRACGNLVRRIPGERYGDGSVDTDERPIWILSAVDDEELAGKLEGLADEGHEIGSVDCGCNS